MTTLYIGQRVRIKWANSELGRKDVGKAGVIISVREGVNADTGLNCIGYGLDISPESHDGECWRNWSPDQLEPLTDSNTLVSWESMRDLWVPEHLREAV